MAPHSLHSDERGFTLVEVMAAILILLVGVLGTVALIDGANAGTTTASDRVGAANLARELVEGARASDYAKLDNSTVVSELRKQPALTGVSSGGWKITRRGVDYTVTATACTYDDAKDGVLNATPAAGYCSNSPTAPVGDKNGDDFRRVVFTVAWQLNGRTRTLQQTTLIPNPSGGLGPRVVSLAQPLTVVQPGSPSVTSCVQATTHVVHLDATTTFADSVHWNTDSPGSEENATQNSNTSWSINWDLDTPP